MNDKVKLLVLDIDDTIISWLSYYSPSLQGQLQLCSQITGTPYSQLCKEAKEIFGEYGSVEYPFVVQLLPSVRNYYQDDVDTILRECAEPARQHFKQIAHGKLKPYKNVVSTLKYLRKNFPQLKIVALTDAPNYTALYKLQQTELLHYFHSIYGLQDPRIPIINGQAAVTQDVLLKHLSRRTFGFIGDIRVLPDEYEKPNCKGMKMILIDNDLEDYQKQQVIYCGDNIAKDTKIANDLKLTAVHAKYGREFDKKHFDVMKEFYPEKFEYRNRMEKQTDAAVPDVVINDFSEILNLFR